MVSQEKNNGGVVSLKRARAGRKTIVITGGAGFLGSHLCERKLQQGHRVVCIDNLQTGSMTNIAPLMNHLDFMFYQHDVITPYPVPGEVHEIYNMACAASPPKYQADPVHTMKTCVIGALNALDLARDKGARVFQASTSEVYGDPDISPQPEGYNGNVNPFGPRACYDEGKRAAEAMFHDFHQRFGTDIRIARIFNTYGPQMDPRDGRVVSNFINQALTGRDITIHGKGQQTRSFCYVDDLLNGIEALMAHEDGLTSPVNIGNPGEFTVLELARHVLRLTGSSSGISFHPKPQDDPMQRKPDIGIAASKLNWAPKVALEDGLVRTIRYFRASLGEPAPLEVAARS